MRVTPDTVAAEHAWVRDRAHATVGLINDVRSALGEAFDTEVASVTEAQYRSEVDAVFADGARAVNVAALLGVLRELDVAGDYPGFVVDEVLGRELAATIAGGAPLSTLAQATFHYTDIRVHSDGGAGRDDLDAALAAGFQTRLPGWEWADRPSPFAVDAGRTD